MSQKRSHIDLDPDYEDVSDQQNKRQRVLEEGAKEATKSKIETIIRKQFGQEIENKEAEIMNISETLERSRTVLDRLRACIVASYYGNASQQKCPQSKSSQQAPMIHPTVKKYLGKAPKGTPPENSTSQQSSASLQMTSQSAKVRVTTEQGTEKIGSMSLDALPGMAIPSVPLTNSQPVTMATKVDSNVSDTRAGRFKIKKRIIVGNVSKTIPADRRDENDQATHKWMVYVRGPKDSPRIDHFVKKVWFFLHPSYRPNDLVEVSEHPFHLTRRGWGEFPVRVQLHFKDSRNKRLDIIHNLKLDRTYTSLQTLGSETVVDVELERDITEVKKKTSKVGTTTGEATITNSTLVVKQEPLDYDQNLNCNSNVGNLQGQVKAEFDPGGHTLINKSFSKKEIPEMKLEPMDHNYWVNAQTTPIAACHNIKQEHVNSPNFVIPGAGNNLRLVFSGLGSQGVASQVIRTVPVTNVSPVKTAGLMQKHSPKSSKKAKPVLQLGNALTLQGVGSLSNSGVLIPNQQTGKQNLVPLLLSNSPTKVSGNQSVLQPGSILLSPALPANTPASGNQLNIQTGSLISPSLPVNQTTLSGNQSNSPGLIFLKCTDNQGKTYLIPQQVSPTLQTSKGAVVTGKGNHATTSKTVVLNNNTQTQLANNSKVSVNVSSSHMKVPVSSSTVNISQLTAVGLQPKQTPVQFAGPLIFIKPEELPKLHTKSSPPSMTVNTKSLQNNQTLRLVTPPKAQTGICTNSADGKNAVNQSIVRGQLKVTSQGLITVQNNDTNFNKNILIKTEPVETSSVSTTTKTSVNNQPTNTVAKQPIVILPQNNKVPVSLQCKSASLLPTAGKVSLVNTLSNFIIVNTGKDSSGQRLALNSLTNTTTSCEIKSSPAAESANLKPGTQKTNMLLLQTKTAGSDKPNHLVIVPVSCASNTVTRPTVSIATMSSTSKTLVVSKSLKTVVSTAVTSASNTVAGHSKETTIMDKNKTMYIVVEGNSNKERSSEVIEGQKSMTSLLNKVTLPANSVTSTSSRTINGKSSNLKLIPAQSLLTTSVLSSSSSFSSSLLSSSATTSSLLTSAVSLPSMHSLPITIPVTISTSGQKETKVLVVNSNSHVTEPEKPWKSDEKKIICLKKNKFRREPEQTIIRPLGSSEDYPDLLSLIRAAVVRHPVVKENTAKFLHPYCAGSNESWLNWNIGKRRSSEWQRASAVRKFLLSYLAGNESFKGEQLWTVKQILTWCRLHAYSPHYMEMPLHPTGLSLQSESSLAADKNHKFRSLSGYSDVLQEVTASQQTSGYHDNSGDDDVDIISTDVAMVKVKQEVKDTGEIPFIEYLPVSDKARFVQDTSKKLGIAFPPTEVEPGYYGHLSTDYIFSAMESFVGDILRESFALQVNMGRYPDALGVADVYRALSNLPITDFVTNKYFGVEDTGGVPTAYR